MMGPSAFPRLSAGPGGGSSSAGRLQLSFKDRESTLPAEQALVEAGQVCRIGGDLGGEGFDVHVADQVAGVGQQVQPEGRHVTAAGGGQEAEQAVDPLVSQPL